jgi:hypothetical protein
MMINDPADNQLLRWAETGAKQDDALEASTAMQRPDGGLPGSGDYCWAGPSSVRYIAAAWAYPAEEYFRLSQLLR